MFNPSTMPRLTEDQAAILNSLPVREVQVPHRRSFREPYTLRDEVIIVRTGLLSMYRDNSMGRRQIVGLRYPGEGIIPPELPPAFGIQALVPSEVFIAARSDFDALVEQNPVFRTLVRQRSERHTAISHEWMLNLSRNETLGRVAHLLCETAVRVLGESYASRMEVPFTQNQIADMTGQTSVNVNRVFGELEERGLIRRRGRVIDFLDWTELQRIGSFSPAYLQ